MLRDLSLSVSPILAVLLIVLSPMGTGRGAHKDQVLDPLFPHVHFAPGMLTSAQSAAALKVSQRLLKGDPSGPALGAGAGATAGFPGAGITPPVPGGLALYLSGIDAWGIALWETLPLAALADPPPDPPPTAA